MKIQLRVFVTAFALSFFWIIFSTFSAAGSNILDTRIISVEGEVTVFYHEQSGEGVPAAEGMPLETGDRVKVGDESRAELGIDGNSVMQLGPGSDMTVTSTERQAAAFELSLGSILAKIKAGLFGDGGTMEVRTPTAVAAVRGTEFAVENSADQGARVGVFDEGKVAVRNRNAAGETLLERGQETEIFSGRAPTPPRPLEHFAARRPFMAKLRQRAAGLRGRWKPLPRARRAALRKRLYTRKRALIREVRERRKEMRRNNRRRIRKP